MATSVETSSLSPPEGEEVLPPHMAFTEALAPYKGITKSTVSKKNQIVLF